MLSREVRHGQYLVQQSLNGIQIRCDGNQASMRLLNGARLFMIGLFYSLEVCTNFFNGHRRQSAINIDC